MLKQNEHSIRTNNNENMILISRWFLFVYLILAYITSNDKIVTETVFAETLALYFVYATVITYITSTKKAINKSTNVLLFSIDIIFITCFSYQLGGIRSDIFFFIFFYIVFSNAFENQTGIIGRGFFCAIAYFISSFLAMGSSILEDGFFKLIVRMLFILIASNIMLYFNKEIKKANELHKTEFKLARTDKLTGLANRHYFEQKLKEEVEYVEETGMPLNILLFDLDNFKSFNDTYGHVWGDKLLTLFSDIIRQNIRKSDIPVRYGGEEFLILVRDLDKEMAKSIAERIRKQLEKQRICIGGNENRKIVTVSCGVSQYPKNANNIKVCIDLADKALYFAKENGKNKVIKYSEINLKTSPDKVQCESI